MSEPDRPPIPATPAVPPVEPSGVLRAYSRRGRRLAWTVLRGSLGVGLLVWMWRTGRFDLSCAGNLRARWGWLLLGLACQLPIPLFSTLRWTIILRAQHLEAGFRPVLRLTLIGRFFAIFLPGGLTGGADVVRGWYAAKLVPRGRRAEAVGTIVLDRCLGYAALTLLVLVCFLLNWRWLGARDPALRFWTGLLILGMGAGFGGLLLLARLAARRGEISRERLQALSAAAPPEAAGAPPTLRRRLDRFLARLGGALDLYRRHRGMLIGAAAVSLGDHVCSILSAACFAGAVGVTGVTLVQYFILIPLGMLGNVIPLAPQGLGTYQLVQGWVCGRLGLAVEQGAWLALLWLIARSLVGMVGVVPYIMGVRERKVTQT